MRRDYLCASDNWNFDASGPCVYGGGSYVRNVGHGLFFLSYNAASCSGGNIGSRLLLGNLSQGKRFYYQHRFSRATRQRLAIQRERVSTAYKAGGKLVMLKGEYDY